ncbi:hypothetical protein WA158_000925 [Blastocystis sp. Blastoise]
MSKHILMSTIHECIQKLACYDEKTKLYTCPICSMKHLRNFTRYIDHLSKEYIYHKDTLSSTKNTLCQTAYKLRIHHVNLDIEQVDHLGESNTMIPVDNEMSVDRFYDDLLCYFLTTNTPFSQVENKYLIQMFSDINSQYKLPKRHSLSNRHLDNTFYKIYEIVEERIRNATRVYLSFDGTTNINQEKFLNVVAIIEHKPYLYCIYNVTYCGETSDSIAYVIYDCMLRIGVNKVKGIVSDNCAANISSREKLIEKIRNAQNQLRNNSSQIPQYEPKDTKTDDMSNENILPLVSCHDSFCNNINELYFFGCASHMGELLLGDFISSEDFPRHYYSPMNIVNKVNAISIYFKYHVADRVELCIEAGHNYCDNTPKFLNDNSFWKSCVSIFDILVICKNSVEKLEANGSSISDVYFYYKQFIHVSNESMYKEIFDRCLSKRKYFYTHQLYILAYYLNIQHKNEIINNPDDVQAIMEYLQESDNRELYSSFLNYAHNDGVFIQNQIINCLNYNNNKMYWQTVNFFEKSLSSLALLLDDAPSSSGFSERVWSQLLLVQTKLRNRLSFSKTAKILFIRCNLPYVDSSESSFMNSDNIDIDELFNPE